jgi:hypothetical protein
MRNSRAGAVDPGCSRPGREAPPGAIHALSVIVSMTGGYASNGRGSPDKDQENLENRLQIMVEWQPAASPDIFHWHSVVRN